MFNPLIHKTMLKLLCLVVMIAFSASFVYAQTCVVSREEVIKDIEAGLTGAELAKKYNNCKPAPPTPQKESTKATILPSPNSPPKLIISNTGSVFYEAITSCGYHPQRKELTCPVEIRQRFGYGGPPAVQPSGSYEYVLFCVSYGPGLVAVNTNGFHVHDELFGVLPNWYFSAVVPANQTLFSQPLDGSTLRARAILSWALSPGNNCNYRPVWGNQADFRIRLDP
jgi:hypothetical protein